MAGRGIPRLKLLAVLFAGWLFWVLFFLGPVNGGVLVARNVVIGGPYGQLTALVDNSMASFTTYANGTIYFDIQGNEHFQGIYQFRVQSYGNGTMQLRFKGIEPFEVRATPATSSYVAGDAWQQLTYTASQTSGLAIVFANPRLSLGLGPWIAAIMLTFIVVARLGFIFFRGEIDPVEMTKLWKMVLVFGIIIFVMFFLGLLFP